MAQQVFPTKSNLMATKKSLALSKQGYELMDRKRNILVREMMQLIDRAAEIQTKIEVAYSSAYRALQRANVTLGMVGKFANSVPQEEGLQTGVSQCNGCGIAHRKAGKPAANTVLLWIVPPPTASLMKYMSSLRK